MIFSEINISLQKFKSMLMKKSLFLLFAMMLGVVTAFSQIAPPYSQGFEDENLFDSEGWTMWYASSDDVNTSGFGIYTDAYYAYAGSNSFMFSSVEYLYDELYEQYLASPRLNTGGNNLTLSFYYMDDGMSETFRVGYTTEATITGDFSNFTWLPSVSTSGDGYYYNYSCTIPSTATFFVIEYMSNYAFYLNIDNLTLTVGGGGGGFADCGSVDMGISHTDNTYYNPLYTMTVPYGSDFDSYFVIYNYIDATDTYNDTISVNWSINGNPQGSLGWVYDSWAQDDVGEYYMTPLLSAADITAQNLWGTTATICYDLVMPACWTEEYPMDNTACIDVTFAPAPAGTYVISASAGAGGTISPAGSTSVTSGGSQAYTITPNSCYQIADVQVDGASVGTPSSYTFSNVQANHNIVVNFSQIVYHVTITAGIGGTVSYNGMTIVPGTPQTVTVNCGDSPTFVFTPDSGYGVGDVTVNGSVIGSGLTYTVPGISSDMTLEVAFVQNGGGNEGEGGEGGGDVQPGVAQYAAAQFELYPNPASDYVEISAQYPIEKIDIVNLLGETVKTIAASSEKVSVNVADLSAGFYAIRVYGQSQMATKKFVKE